MIGCLTDTTTCVVAKPLVDMNCALLEKIEMVLLPYWTLLKLKAFDISI